MYYMGEPFFMCCSTVIPTHSYLKESTGFLLTAWIDL